MDYETCGDRGDGKRMEEQKTPTGSIYTIICNANSHAYVGQSARNIAKRFEEHKYRLNRNVHVNIHLQRAWNIYGENSFEFNVVEEVDVITIENLAVAENKWLDHFRSKGIALFNICEAGGSTLGYKFSPELRKSRAAWRIGKPLREKTKQLIRDALKGKPLPLQTRLKMKESANSSETRQKKAARLAKTWTFESPQGKIVQICNLNQFCRENNLDAGNMGKVASGKTKSHKGWKAPRV